MPKQIIFSLFDFALLINLEIVLLVSAKLVAEASLLEISETEWLLKSAIAASMIVGVGEYFPIAQLSETIDLPTEKIRTFSITSLSNLGFVFIGYKRLSLCGVLSIIDLISLASVAISIGANKCL